MMKNGVAFLFLLCTMGCNAAVGVSGGVQVPHDAAATCAGHCSTLGLQLSAVAIMANNVGCVCQPRSQVGTVSDFTAGTSAGMATIAMQQAEYDQARAARNQQQQAH
ncbi:MAG TPA: hypothetical protein VIV60_15490 [Polyangiaceae bacterium]